MNTAMWEHPLTHQQLNILKGFGASGVLRVVTPVVKELACGETGQGALANVSDIVQEVNTCCLSSK
jgi:phosphopantothenoylcysteine decarboxylase